MIGIFTLFSCNKDEIASKNVASKLQLRAKGDSNIDSLLYYASLMFTSRDIVRHQADGEKLNIGHQDETTSQASMSCGCTGGYECNGIKVFDTACFYPSCLPTVLKFDAFNNQIHAVGTYGTDDPRQKYYVYYPANKNPNSPVVLLIHGGGWFSGPNPSYTLGWPFSYSDNSTDNIVKDLLNNGYVVVSMLYRLGNLAYNNTDIQNNTVTINTQIQDVSSCVNHIKTNFKSCLNLDTTKLQILGESAGGLLALMYAYTQSDPSYLKSVISCYTASNFKQYATFIYDKSTCPTNPYVCGTPYRFNPPNDCGYTTQYPFFPKYGTFDLSSTTVIFNSNSNSCMPQVRDCVNSINTDLPSQRVFDGALWLQSVVAQVITNPSTPNNNTNIFYALSPCNNLTTTKNIPTFIMHGQVDKLVPYSQSTSTMKTKFQTIGGLINDIGTNTPLVPTTYSSTPRHLIKRYPQADHGFGGGSFTTVRTDITRWLNGHL